MKYVTIPQTCPECGSRLACYVEAQQGFACCEPDYAVLCRHCGKTVRLELPGPPIDITPPRRPRFPRWPMQRLRELLWRLVPPAVFKILEPQVDWEAISKWLFNRWAARAGVG